MEVGCELVDPASSCRWPRAAFWFLTCPLSRRKLTQCVRRAWVLQPAVMRKMRGAELSEFAAPLVNASSEAVLDLTNASPEPRFAMRSAERDARAALTFWRCFTGAR